MIGKPEWFTYRKYGWGIAPKTKEGWIYILVFIAIISGIGMIPVAYPEVSMELYLSILMAPIILVVFDSIDIMIKLPKAHDERENLHQLIIERNVSWAGIGAIVCVILYQSIRYSMDASKGIVNSGIPFDWEIGVILAVMVIAKGVSSYYVDKKM